MKEDSLIRVLIADDSALMRNLITRLLSKAPDIVVAATARDGEDAIRKAIELKPDVVTMDINMPKLDGISAMQMILGERICPVIMFSSLTHQGAIETLECLELGAFDYVAKPDGTVSANLDGVARDLIAKVRAAAASGQVKRARPRLAPPARRPAAPAPAPSGLMRAVAIGISTGGPATISTVLPYLSADFPAAIFLVQHMPAAFVGAFVSRLQKECAIQVHLAEAGGVVRPGCCYGAEQMVNIRNAGGVTIAESQESCVVFGMPCQAIKRGGAEFVLPSWKIADKLRSTVAGGAMRRSERQEAYL